MMSPKRSPKLRALCVAIALFSMACGGDVIQVEDNTDVRPRPVLGKGDTFGNPTLTLRGAVEGDLQLQTAEQCDLDEYLILAAWPNADRQDLDLSIFRLALSIPNGGLLSSSQSVDLSVTGSRVAFDGLAYSSARAGGCSAAVLEHSNGGPGQQASIALNLSDCKLSNDAGSTITLSGTFGCRGQGYQGSQSSSNAQPGNNTTTNNSTTIPTDDPCAGKCDDSEACVLGLCTPRSLQTQEASCASPRSACDPGEDQDCADDHVCVGGKCRNLACQHGPDDCSTSFAPCQDSDDCDSNNSCIAGFCRQDRC